MKVLFISGWFPYPTNNGSRIRIYNLIKHLSQKNDVFLLSLLQDDSNPNDREELADICKVISLHRLRKYKPNSLSALLGFLSNRPRSYVASYNPEIKKAVKKAINKIRPDVIVASTLDVVDYLIDDLVNFPSVLIDHNCEFSLLKRNTNMIDGKLRRLRYELGWKKFAHWESEICRQFSAVVMPTEEDKRQMLSFAPDIKNIHVISNAADTSLYDPGCWSPESGRLIYTGPLVYGANLDAVQFFSSEIYPIIDQQIKGTSLVVTGRMEGVDTSSFIDNPSIKLIGYVDDIRNELYKSSVCIVPLRKGAGMRLKIPEAMAAGVPVVSTTLGAEGLNCIDNMHLLIADTPLDFANAVVRILSDDNLAQKLRVNGRAFIDKNYSWEIHGKAFVDLVEKVAQSNY